LIQKNTTSASSAFTTSLQPPALPRAIRSVHHPSHVAPFYVQSFDSASPTRHIMINPAPENVARASALSNGLQSRKFQSFCCGRNGSRAPQGRSPSTNRLDLTLTRSTLDYNPLSNNTCTAIACRFLDDNCRNAGEVCHGICRLMSISEHVAESPDRGIMARTQALFRDSSDAGDCFSR
jgi:hypothetical protein